MDTLVIRYLLHRVKRKMLRLAKVAPSPICDGKLFCIGFTKTGTTSLGEAVRGLGYWLGDQRKGEVLIEDWARRDFGSTFRLCRTADAFQDIPFCLPYTYQALDAAFPGSKFILTVRNSSDEWYESLVRFQTQLVGMGRIPTAKELKVFPYRYKGWIWRLHQLLFGANEDSLYDKQTYIETYESHNRNIVEYFRHRSESLLTLNVSHPTAMEALCSFVGETYDGRAMPHLNASKNHSIQT